MADGASARRVDMARAWRDAGFTAVLACGLLLPLIGFQTITDTRNNLVLVTRWPLLFGLVAFVGIARFVFSIAIAPYLPQHPRRRAIGCANGSCPSPSPSSSPIRASLSYLRVLPERSSGSTISVSKF